MTSVFLDLSCLILCFNTLFIVDTVWLILEKNGYFAALA
jgi:hypothetical protein